MRWGRYVLEGLESVVGDVLHLPSGPEGESFSWTFLEFLGQDGSPAFDRLFDVIDEVRQWLRGFVLSFVEHERGNGFSDDSTRCRM